jgi:hypothetical protein
VNRLRQFQPQVRLLLAAVLALCLGVRVLTPAGFMPSFASGSLANVPCPDAGGVPPAPPMPPMHDMAGMAMADMAPMHDMAGMAMADMAPPAPVHDHDHGSSAFHHPSCPYASAASLAGLDFGDVVLAVVVLLAALLPLAPALPAFSRHATRDRPPAQGPPLPA